MAGSHARLCILGSGLWVLASLCFFYAHRVHGQAPPADGVRLLLGRLHQALDREDDPMFASLFDSSLSATQLDGYRNELMRTGVVRRVVRERDRLPLENVASGEGYRLVVELFEEMAGQGRLITARLTVRRPPSGGADSWRITEAEDLSSMSGLYRLRLDTSRQYAVQNLIIEAPDLVLTLKTGSVFLVHSDEGISGVVLLGDGQMRFTPGPDSERGQLRLFAGADSLTTAFDQAMIRLNPLDYPKRVAENALRSVPVDGRAAGRAADVVDRELPKALTVDLHEVSSHTWHLLPKEGDVLAEIRTRQHGTLTFSRFGAQPEDISLVHRDRRLMITLYPSPANLADRGRFYSDDLQREYDVIDYDIEASVAPARGFLRARARLEIQARGSISAITLRLADALTVTSVTSGETGPLGYLRLKNQNTLLVRLPRTLSANASLTLAVTYSGYVESPGLENEAFQQPPDVTFRESEPHLLQSSASNWYPQNPFADSATATLRINVPDGYSCVASGEPVADLDAAAGDADLSRVGKRFVFRASQPARYLAFVISRFTKVDERTLSLGNGAAAGSGSDRLRVSVESNPLQRTRARDLVTPTEDILRFYSTILGDAPYPSTTLAVVEAELPGGHSPPYFVMLNSPFTTSAVVWRNDPAAFPGYPHYFLAHELAHQWWGHAVGGKNYREQWISEGFAQYFSAMYAHKSRGDRVFTDMLKQFRDWALKESDMGPVHLGYRLGRIKGGPRVFRALVYNKGAAVLHMLRRIVGDDAFFEGLRRFYNDRKFQAAGTDDLQRAFELESGRSLDRFFERWIYGTEIPRLAYRSTIAEREVTIRLEQLTERVFDVPVTVTLVQADGRQTDVVVVMTEKLVEHKIQTEGRAREVQVNRDSAALAEFVGR